VTWTDIPPANVPELAVTQHEGAISVGAAQIIGTLTDAQIPDDITIDLAATATALATDPAACPAGEYVYDLAADGTLTCATPAGGASAMDDLTDVSAAAVAEGEILVYRSGAYVPEAKPAAGSNPACGDITNSTTAGCDVLTAADAAAQRTAIGAEPAGVTVADVTDLDDDAATLTIGAGASVSGANTGDQDLSGYLTAETDPVYGAAPAAGITAQDLLDWAEAHDWGDHAGLYVPASEQSLAALEARIGASLATDGEIPTTPGEVGADPAGTGASEAAAAVSTHEAAADPHPGYVLESDAADAYEPAGLVPAPATPTDACAAGQRAWSSPYLYTCVAANTWVRVTPERTW
jgi:hypothetical protein